MRVRRKRALGEKILDLTQSNPTRANLDRPIALVSSVLSNIHASVYQPDPRGLLEGREAIAQWYSRRNIPVQADSVFLTSGTSEAYSFLFSLLCDGGQTVLVPHPGYPLLEQLAQSLDIFAKPYELTYDGEWSVDWSTVEDQLFEAVKAIVVVHPNNPTGSYVKAGERGRLAKLLQRHSLALVADEVFWSYPLESAQQEASFALDSEHLTFVLNGASKVLGLPQLKVSWIVVSGPQEAKEEALERLEMMGDLLLSVSTPIQAALPVLLERSEELARPIEKRIAQNFTQLQDAVRSSPAVELLRCEGGWNAILRVPRIRSDEEWALLFLEHQGVLVLPGSQFDCATDGLLVVSLLPEPKIFRQGMERLILEVEAELGSARP
jgi:alanine-synthesizing transaminase